MRFSSISRLGFGKGSHHSLNPGNDDSPEVRKKLPDFRNVAGRGNVASESDESPGKSQVSENGDISSIFGSCSRNRGNSQDSEKLGEAWRFCRSGE